MSWATYFAVPSTTPMSDIAKTIQATPASTRLGTLWGGPARSLGRIS